MEKFLIVSLAAIISLLPLALFGRCLWCWLRQANLVAELTEETIRLSDLAGGLKEALAVARGDVAELEEKIVEAERERDEALRDSNVAMEENEKLGRQIYTLEDRITELEAASRTDHQTIGDLHQQLARAKRQLASAKGQVSRLKKLAGVPAPARKRGGK